MKHNLKRFSWLFTIIVLLVGVPACQPAELAVEPTEVESTEVESTEVESTVLDETGLGEQGSSETSSSMPAGITTDSGLQYTEITAGEGPNPKDGDIVTMHYVASLPDGTEIGNSNQTGEPIKAILGRNQLLPGWEEGLKRMKAGGKARMVLPPELAFGTEGYGMVPPDSTIILVIEILNIEVPPTAVPYSEEDLTTTDSGLQYYDFQTGVGEPAKNGDIVTNNFKLWVMTDPENLYVGSSEGNQPISFEIGVGDTVFPGWEEGNLDMQIGGKRLLIIPPELGFGDSAVGDIPPNSVLIMEIELLDISQPVMMTEVEEDAYTTTESGLKFYDIVEGDGDMPVSGQLVVVHYTGWLEDGTKFDSSIERGEPFTFLLGTGSVIPGWEEGLATMKKGGKRQLVIPAALGYGETGSGIIPPGATLIFDIELLEIME